MNKYDILKNILELVDGQRYSQITIDTIEALTCSGEWNGEAAIYEIRNLHSVMRSDILDWEFWDSVLTIIDAL